MAGFTYTFASVPTHGRRVVVRACGTLWVGCPSREVVQRPRGRERGRGRRHPAWRWRSAASRRAACCGVARVECGSVCGLSEWRLAGAFPGAGRGYGRRGPGVGRLSHPLAAVASHWETSMSGPGHGVELVPPVPRILHVTVQGSGVRAHPGILLAGGCAQWLLPWVRWVWWELLRWRWRSDLWMDGCVQPGRLRCPSRLELVRRVVFSRRGGVRPLRGRCFPPLRWDCGGADVGGWVQRVVFSRCWRVGDLRGGSVLSVWGGCPGVVVGRSGGGVVAGCVQRWRTVNSLGGPASSSWRWCHLVTGVVYVVVPVCRSTRWLSWCGERGGRGPRVML